MTEEVLSIFAGLFFFAIVVAVIASALRKSIQSSREKQRMEGYKRAKAAEDAATKERAAEEERRRQEELKRRLAKKYGLLGYDDKPSTDDSSRKHALHVEDAHEHGHSGEEEHYDEIVGSLGEVNDEGCADLNGVRFIANDIAYEIQSQETPDYDRIAQAMVLGEIINSPRFKSPYTRRK